MGQVPYTMYVTDGLVLNGATSVPKFVLCYVLDKDLIWRMDVTILSAFLRSILTVASV